MISERITLQTNPLFEFVFSQEGFQVTDNSKDNNNRFYRFEYIKNVESLANSSNWVITILNFIFFGGPKYHFYDRQQIKFKYGKEEVTLLTENCDFKTVKQISEKIKSHISNLNTQY